MSALRHSPAVLLIAALAALAALAASPARGWGRLMA